MPITIKPSQLKYKDPSTSQYVSVAAVADLSALPIATVSTPGLIKASGSGSGLQLDSSGYLKLSYPGDSTIKAGTNLYAPVVVGLQHKSVFYGLAAAAGDITQASSSNAVGTYTDTAKTAIQNMLNVPSSDNPIFTGVFSLGRKASTTAGTNSFACGHNVEASGFYSYAIGDSATASGQFAFASGHNTLASGWGSHTEGEGTQALGQYSHAEGSSSIASSVASHAEGFQTLAFHMASHAEGFNAISYSFASHAEGMTTIARGNATHAGGMFNIPNTADNWVASTTYQVDDVVKYNNDLHICITANNDSVFDTQKWYTYKGTYAETIGNGTDTNNLSNARALDWNGNEYLNGYLYVGCNADSTGGIRIPHDIQINGTSIVNNGIANIPVASYLNAGIIKTSTDFGTNMRDAPNQDTLMIVKADSENIKAATQKWKPIVPYHQHESVFYGLAKAAGADMSSSSNAVGIYTDAAKTAIQNMLEVPSSYSGKFEYSISLGRKENTTIGGGSVACGYNVTASNSGSVAFGDRTTSAGSGSYAEGSITISSGNGSHAEGQSTLASGHGSHAEGTGTQALGIISHAEGFYTVAAGDVQHVGGQYNVVDNYNNWPEYDNNIEYSAGDKIKVLVDNIWKGFIFDGTNWNLDALMNYSEIIGNGKSENTRSNGRVLDWNGNERLNGYLYVGCNADSTGGIRVPHDIQLNSTSIVSNGIATIPIAGDSTFGVIKTREYTDGFKFDSNNNFQLAGPSDAQIKAADTNYRAITPYVQHTSVFYGLAKAAGDSTQSASSNAIGIYTDNAKAQIQKMIGNYEPDYTLVNDITLTEETTLDLTTTDDNTPYNFRNVYIYISYPADTASVASGYDRYRFYDSSNTFIIAETRKYTTKTLNNFKHIHLIRKANMTLVQYTFQANTGDSGNWNIKAYPDGIRFGMGNITRIMMPDADAEPAGTRIRVFAQWAY